MKKVLISLEPPWLDLLIVPQLFNAPRPLFHIIFIQRDNGNDNNNNSSITFLDDDDDAGMIGVDEERELFRRSFIWLLQRLYLLLVL